MHLLVAPFIIGGLVLKIYNNKKNRPVTTKEDTQHARKKTGTTQ